LGSWLLDGGQFGTWVAGCWVLGQLGNPASDISVKFANSFRHQPTYYLTTVLFKRIFKKTVNFLGGETTDQLNCLKSHKSLFFIHEMI
jgi:hypothetical protein